jgi:hypothetical protein
MQRARRWSGAFVVVFAGLSIVVAAGCADRGSLFSTSEQRDGATDADAQVTIPSGSDASDVRTDDCRWVGYGIGELGHGQCDTQHLLAHAAAECSGLGGQPTAFRDVADQCVSQADEVQVFCCFGGSGIPTVATPVAGPSLLNEHETPDGAVLTRNEVLANLAQTCAQRGQRLGDWSILYGADATSPDAVWFSCR